MNAPKFVYNLPFAKALTDRTGGQRRILRRDYLKTGILPVVDQGGDLIAGYTDDDVSAYDGDLPVIIFGDHTRVFKYVDFPFAIGADGAKVLEPSAIFEPRYLYYYLSAQEIPSRGYSRHLQFLRKISMRWVPKTEQRRIVEILDQADYVRRLCTEADARSADFLPALFLRLLGAPESWTDTERCRPLYTVADLVGGATPSKQTSHYWGGDIPWITPKDVKKDFLTDSRDHISKVALEETKLTLFEVDAPVIVVRGMILARDVPVALTRCRATVNQDMKVLVPKTEAVSGASLWASLVLAKSRLLSLVRVAGHGTRKLDTSDLKYFSIPVPDPDTVVAIESAVQRQHRLQVHLSERRHTLANLYNTLVSRAFDGSLTAAWRQAHMEELLREMEQQEKALVGV